VSNVQGDEKTSHITQRGRGESYAESQGWTVVGAFEDLDVSAIKLSPWDRPDLKAWLTDRVDDWDALIFAKTDRVFRSAADCVKLAEWCKEHHKILVLVDDGIKLDYFSPEDAKDAFAGAMSKVFLILASVFAEIEGQRFVQRARDRVAYLRNTDRWGYGLAPFGFEIDDQMILSNPTTQGIKTAGTDCSVKRTVGKPILDSEGEPVRVGPASFDADTWNRIQSELAQRAQSPRQRRHSTNPMLGVAKCGLWGMNMRQQSKTTPAGVTHRYYICAGSPPCSKVSIIAADAEELVEQAFPEVHADRRVKARVWQDGSDHTHELEQTNLTIEALREDRGMGLFTTPDEQTFRQQMSALIAKRESLAAMPVCRPVGRDRDGRDPRGCLADRDS